MSEPKLLRGWDAFAEYLQVSKSRLLHNRHDLKLKGVVFTRKITKPNRCKQRFVFAWSDKLREWEMEIAAKEYAERIANGPPRKNETTRKVDSIDNQQNTG